MSPNDALFWPNFGQNCSLYVCVTIELFNVLMFSLQRESNSNIKFASLLNQHMFMVKDIFTELHQKMTLFRKRRKRVSFNVVIKGLIQFQESTDECFVCSRMKTRKNPDNNATSTIMECFKVNSMVSITRFIDENREN